MPIRRVIQSADNQLDASDATHARRLVDNTDLVATDAVVKALVVLKGTVDDLVNNDESDIPTALPTTTLGHTVSFSVTNSRGVYSLVITMIDSSGRNPVTKTATIALS